MAEDEKSKMNLDRIRDILGKDGRKLLIYHTDVDGICSAALFLKFFPDFKPLPREGPVIDRKFLSELIEEKPAVLAVVDIPVDQEWEKMEKLQEDSPETSLLVIDHHVPVKSLESEKNVHINPRFSENVYIPASVLVYKLMRDLGKDVKSLVWIAATGVIGDYALEDCNDIFDECREAYPEFLGRKPLDSEIRKISEKIMSTFILKGREGVEKSLELTVKAERPEDILGNSYFSDCEEKVRGEIERILKDFRDNAKKHEDIDLLIYRINSRLNISSTVSSIVAAKHPDKMIFITKHSDHHVKVSARYQAGEIDLNSLMKKITAGIGSGGGHEKAAGAMINRKDWKEFEKRLIEEVTRQKLS